MGKIIKISSFVILILVCSSLLSSLFLSKSNSALYKIFELETDGYYLNKLLGLVPKDVKDRYSEQLLASSDGSELICISDRSSSINKNFIVLRNESKEYFIKAYPFKLLKKDSEREIDLNNYISHLIDLDVFNMYIQAYGITNEKDIIRKYCYFLSILEESDSYRIVNNRTDIDFILTQHPLDNTDALTSSRHDIIDLNSIGFEESQEEVYCWFVNHGFIKFKFAFEAGKLIKAEGIIVGYLGNEFPSCC